MVNPTKILLASTSPRRQALIHSLGYSVEIIPNAADETIVGNLPPAQVVETLAERKAVMAFQKRQPEVDEVIVAGDTIVVIDGERLGKPKDKEDAFQMLKRLQGRDHMVYSGIACIEGGTGRKQIAHSATRVEMKPLTDQQIREYIQTGEPMDKAGAYAIQGIGATIVKRIEGDFYTVVGLPLSLLDDMLKRQTS
ncbi:Maf family protein [Camelliibacillus cellulosilyticus]|jgi:septum formation protein|uniref:dTTP/UTP pyrophosphatase n=1 Tax=Camelliibacillus cellulosilyticus TaxID=2174486 RepID=A0ABV9GRP9_9BACL